MDLSRRLGGVQHTNFTWNQPVVVLNDPGTLRNHSRAGNYRELLGIFLTCTSIKYLSQFQIPVHMQTKQGTNTTLIRLQRGHPRNSQPHCRRVNPRNSPRIFQPSTQPQIRGLNTLLLQSQYTLKSLGQVCLRTASDSGFRLTLIRHCAAFSGASPSYEPTLRRFQRRIAHFTGM